MLVIAGSTLGTEKPHESGMLNKVEESSRNHLCSTGTCVIIDVEEGEEDEEPIQALAGSSSWK
jgi:hypothetical protein